MRRVWLIDLSGFKMGQNLYKLFEISSPAICCDAPKLPRELLATAGQIGAQLAELLIKRNGFYALDGALHVFHSGCPMSQPDIEKWNLGDSWKACYEGAADGYLFFAEDILGEQFALGKDRVHRFDPETAGVEEVAENLEGWASRILERYEYETGYPLARDWKEENGVLPPGERLLPKIPFILGGAYHLSNLYALDAVKGMKFRGDMWRQLRDLPPCTKVTLKITE